MMIYYRSALRILSLVVAIVLVFQSGLVGKTASLLTNDTIRYVASVAKMTASVEPTELNKYTTALTRKENELKRREEIIRERELKLGIPGRNDADKSFNFNGGGGYYNDKQITLVLAIILFILLILIIMNYVADYGKFKRILNELEKIKESKENLG